MKIENKNSLKKIIATSIVSTIIIGGAAVYAFRENLGITGSTNNPDTYSEPSEKEIEGEKTSNQQAKPYEDTDVDVDFNPNTTEPDTSESSEIVISALNQDDNTLQIRTMIRPMVSGGVCTATLSKAGEAPVRKTAETQSMPSYSTCQGFSFDTANLTNGRWDVELNYSNESTNITTHGSVTIQ